jgi:hypothetical protein
LHERRANSVMSLGESAGFGSFRSRSRRFLNELKRELKA